MPLVPKGSVSSVSVLARRSESRARRSTARLIGPARENTDIHHFAQMSAVPHTVVQRIHRALSSTLSAASRRVNHAAEVCKRMRDFHVQTTNRADSVVAPGMSPNASTLVLIEKNFNPSGRSSSMCDECHRKNLGCLSEYHFVVFEVLISDPDCCERHFVARVFPHPAQYMVHAGVEKCWDNNKPLMYHGIN